MEWKTLNWSFDQLYTRFDPNTRRFSKPSPTSMVLTTDFESVSAKWVLKLKSGQLPTGAGANGPSSKIFWYFKLKLLAVEMKANAVEDNDGVPLIKRRRVEDHNKNIKAKIQVKAGIVLYTGEEYDPHRNDPGRPPSFYRAPPRLLSFDTRNVSGDLGWPSLTDSTNGPTSTLFGRGSVGHERKEAEQIINVLPQLLSPNEDKLYGYLQMIFISASDLSSSSPRSRASSPPGAGTSTSTLVSAQHTFTKSFSTDLGRLLESGQDSDLILKCGPESFRVHKLILSTRSPVLRAMLQSLTTTSTEEACAPGEIEIENCNPVVMKVFLGYLYTGEVEQLSNLGSAEMNQLIGMADKYDTTELKDAVFAWEMQD